MDKKLIKRHLENRFLSEEATPGIAVTAKVKKESGKNNKEGVAAIEKQVKDYDKDTKKKADSAKMAPNKFNYNDDFEKTYHDEMEILNGQEMIQYDSYPNKEFTERALEAIEGSSRMGNQGGIANAQATWGASSDDFGKNLVKRIKGSIKKRGQDTPAISLRGKDIQELPTKKVDNGHRPVAIEEMAAPMKPISDKNKQVLTNWVTKLGPKEAAVKLINTLSETGMISDLPDSMEYGQGLNKIEAYLSTQKFNEAYITAKKLAAKLEKQAMKDMGGMYENKNNNNNKPQIKESMKRLKFKNLFNGLGNALKLIPEGYKVDNKEFEMTDGNESYRIRWEGNLTEGKAVVLTMADKKLVNEDIQRMKALFNYKSQDTLGLVKGNARIDENKTFTDIWNKSKALLTESEQSGDIESVSPKTGEWDKIKPGKGSEVKKSPSTKGSDQSGNIEDASASEGEWEEATPAQAPEAKKHVEGSVKEDPKTNAPKPKEGEWDKIKISQAPEAKKDIKGSTSTDKGTKAPKAKEGEWEEAKTGQASEAKKHVESGESTKKKFDKAKVVKETAKEEEIMDGNMEETEDVVEEAKPVKEAKKKAKKVVKENEEEPEVGVEPEAPEVDSEEGAEPEADNYYKMDDDDGGVDDVEPAAKDVKSEVPPMDTDDDDNLKVASPTSGTFELKHSMSTGEYWIFKDGAGEKVPDELLGIAADKSIKGAKRAATIYQKMQDAVDFPTGGEDDELDEIGAMPSAGSNPTQNPTGKPSMPNMQNKLR